MDDDEWMHETLSMALEDEGYRVIRASDGQEALAHLDLHHPDVIVLDWMMPTLNGPSFVEELRRRGLHPGIPILVLLFYIAFVAVPALVAGWNALAEPLGLEPLQTRDVSLMWRAIIALTVGYAAFIAEVFRAGIQSVDPGQIEAAKALGLTAWQRFRLVVLPQAVRTILPPLGNDFIALIKDSALVSVLGVADITQLGKVYAAGSFRVLETYNVVAFLYLVMTLGLSLALRALERRLRARQS